MDYDCDFGEYESLQDEIALEGRQEWDKENAAYRDDWDNDEDWTEEDEFEQAERWDEQFDEFDY